jgi:hypothetical protein
VNGRADFGALLLICLASSAAWAADEPLPRFEVTPFGGYRIGGEFELEDDQGTSSGDVDFDSAASWGVGLGLYRDRNGFYEFLYSRQSTEFDDNDPALEGVDVVTEYFQFGGTIVFDDEDWVHPYFSLTIGVTRFDVDGFGSEIEPSGSVGFGLRFPASNNLSLLLGVRAYGTLVDSDTDLFCSSINGEAICIVQGSGNVVYQGEALAGLAFRF